MRREKASHAAGTTPSTSGRTSWARIRPPGTAWCPSMSTAAGACGRACWRSAARPCCGRWASWAPARPRCCPPGCWSRGAAAAQLPAPGSLGFSVCTCNDWAAFCVYTRNDRAATAEQYLRLIFHWVPVSRTQVLHGSLHVRAAAQRAAQQPAGRAHAGRLCSSQCWRHLHVPVQALHLAGWQRRALSVLTHASHSCTQHVTHAITGSVMTYFRFRSLLCIVSTHA